jgi:hypothetical protein
MVQLSTLLVYISVLSFVFAIPAKVVSDSEKRHECNDVPLGGSLANIRNAKAVYFISNAARNSIVALNVAADGTLSNGTITFTGGAGMQGIENGAPAAPDALFSQGAVKVAGNVGDTAEFLIDSS